MISALFRRWVTLTPLLILGAVADTWPQGTSSSKELETDSGYRGIWYMNQPSNDEYRYKYSGGFATYPQQHVPIAIYSPVANKTFFCYGGTAKDKSELWHMVSYYDHATGTVPRPRILLNKKTNDAHDNPTISLDGEGHIWIFSNSHGTGRPTYIHRSIRPYDIDAFQEMPSRNFSYSQPWHIRGKGFLFLHTRYDKGRSLFWMTSPDGSTWSKGQLLARVEQGHYQISNIREGKAGTAFNYHPRTGGLNARTNLYYVETPDMGASWQTVSGERLDTPITTTDTKALVRDYEKEGKLVYLKDLNWDSEGRPIILFLTTPGYESGPKNDPRTWMTAHWTGDNWRIRELTRSDHNYDFGSLYVEDGTWRVIAPTEPGPQQYSTGGEVVMWTSADEGASWTREKQLTKESQRNHTYVRRPKDAHPEFYALWADGNALEPGTSFLYFTNRNGSNTWRFPATMTGESAKPEVAW